MKLNRIVGVLLSLCLIISTSINANASEIRPQDEEIAAIAIASDETNLPIRFDGITYSVPTIPMEKLDSESVVEFIKKSPKGYSHATTTIDISKLLEEVDVLATNANGEISDSFMSPRLDTGTPGVTWDYKVDYTIAPMPSGNGWYFKDVDCTVYAYKGWTFYTWATIGLLDFTYASTSLSPSNYPTSLTVNMTLSFQIWTDATGPDPIEYSENHSHTTTINNIAVDS